MVAPRPIVAQGGMDAFRVPTMRNMEGNVRQLLDVLQSKTERIPENMQPTDSLKGLLDLQADPKQGQVVSLAFSVRPLGPERNIIAQVTYGVGGAGASFFMDVSNGVSICVPASVLSVGVANTAPAAGAPNSNDCMVSAFAGYGQLSGQPSSRPTFTFIQNNLNAGATVQIPVPPFTKDVTVYRTGAPPAAYTLDAFNQALAVLYSESYAAGEKSQPMMISSDATFIRVTNNAAVATRLRCMFGLMI